MEAIIQYLCRGRREGDASERSAMGEDSFPNGCHRRQEDDSSERIAILEDTITKLYHRRREY